MAAVVLLINAARRFPQTAELWEAAEEASEDVRHSTVSNIRISNARDDESPTYPSYGSVIIVFSIIFSAIIQTIVGTLTTVVINSELGNFTTIEGKSLFIYHLRKG